MRRLAFACLSVLVLSGCYHATVETGLTPGPQSVDVPWAHGFVFGLVPPSTVNAMSQCSNGVARVETQLSFLNQLVSFPTFSLYTPMQINVTCAAGDQEQGDLVDTAEELEKALASGEPFYLDLR